VARQRLVEPRSGLCHRLGDAVSSRTSSRLRAHARLRSHCRGRTTAKRETRARLLGRVQLAYQRCAQPDRLHPQSGAQRNGSGAERDGFPLARRPETHSLGQPPIRDLAVDRAEPHVLDESGSCAGLLPRRDLAPARKRGGGNDDHRLGCTGRLRATFQTEPRVAGCRVRIVLGG
jgi:hypothetical protein